MLTIKNSDAGLEIDGKELKITFGPRPPSLFAAPKAGSSSVAAQAAGDAHSDCDSEDERSDWDLESEDESEEAVATATANTP